MLYKLGRGLTGYKSALTGALFTRTSFTFTSTLDTAFTAIRADAGSTARDSSGNWKLFAANTPRFDHTAAGVTLGVRTDPPRTNLVNHPNFTVGVGGISVISGDGTASIVSDTTNLANAAIDGSDISALGDGNAIALTGGTTNTTYRVSLGTVNINNHSYRALIARQGTGYHGNIKMNNAIGQRFFNLGVGVYEEIIVEDFAVDITSRYLQIYVTAGNTIHVKAIQLEQGAKATYPIVTTGSAGLTTGREYLHSDLSTMPWWNNSQGSMIGEFVFDKLDGAGQYAMLASTNGGLSNAVGMYLITTYGQVVGRDVIGGSSKQLNHIHKPINNHRMPLAISWKDNQSLTVAGPMRSKEVVYTGVHTSMDDLYLGSRPYVSTMSGWIKSLVVYDVYRNLAELSVDMFPVANDYSFIAAGGQSNMEGYFRSNEERFNGGEVNFVSKMDIKYPTTENWLINGSWGGSRIIDKNTPADDNWWYDLASDTFGPRMAQWEAIVNSLLTANPNTMQYYLWNQGESDSAASKADFKTATLKIFERMRAVGGNKDIYLTHIGRRAGYQDTNYNTIRDAQDELVAENSYVFLTPENFIQPLESGGALVHLTDVGYAAHAAMVGERIFDDRLPPIITGVVRSGTTITVTLTHGAGTDFTPTTNIAGFHFYDDGIEITQSILPVWANSTTITMTLDSTPTGVETLYYGYGTLFDEVSTYTNLVIDNSTLGLPLQHYKGTL